MYKAHAKVSSSLINLISHFASNGGHLKILNRNKIRFYKWIWLILSTHIAQNKALFQFLINLIRHFVSKLQSFKNFKLN